MKENGAVFLTSKPPMFSGMLEDILKQNGIPYIKKSTVGAGLAWKLPHSEHFNFFVPKELHEKAKELLAHYFEG